MEDMIKLAQLMKHYKGYDYFRECVSLAAQDESVLTAMTKELYMPVSEKYHTSYACVERDIRTMCRHAWRCGAREIVYHLYGIDWEHVPSNRICIEIMLFLMKQYN